MIRLFLYSMPKYKYPEPHPPGSYVSAPVILVIIQKTFSFKKQFLLHYQQKLVKLLKPCFQVEFMTAQRLECTGSGDLVTCSMHNQMRLRRHRYSELRRLNQIMSFQAEQKGSTDFTESPTTVLKPEEEQVSSMLDDQTLISPQPSIDTFPIYSIVYYPITAGRKLSVSTLEDFNVIQLMSSEVQCRK